MKKINLSLIFGAERDYLIQTLSFLKADALSYSERLKINLYGVHYKEIDKRGFLRGLLLKENLEIKEKKNYSLLNSRCYLDTAFTKR